MNSASHTTAIGAHSGQGGASSFGSRSGVVKALAVAMAVLAGMLPRSATAQTVNGHGAIIGKTTVATNTLTHRAHVGDVARSIITLQNADNFGDSLTISNIFDTIHHFNGDEITGNLLRSNLFFTNALGMTNLLPGQSVQVGYFYTIRQADQFLTNGVLQDFAQAWTTDKHDGPGGSLVEQTFTNSHADQLQVLVPAICVSNICLGISNGFATYRSAVSNCGNTMLTGVVVRSFCNGVFQANVLGPVDLDTNQVIRFTNSYPSTCIANTLWAWGSDTLRTNFGGNFGLLVSNSASATCTALGCIGDYVWEDLNRDGIQNESNTGIPNVPVQLINCANGGVLRTTNTGPTGLYLFCDLLPGMYRVQFSVPSGYRVTLSNTVDDCIDSDGNSLGQTDCITLLPGEVNLCVDLGLYRPPAIGDFVWRDTNTNGVQETNTPPFELGVPNVAVKLIDCNGGATIRTTNTDANGRYLFTDLVPGSFSVMFVAPTNFSFTGQDLGGNDVLDSDANPVTGMTICYTLISGQTNLTVDAGLVPIPILACLGDFVWEDRNTNGVQETNAPLFEPGIPGVVVRLLDCTGVVLQSTTTDINGRYLFCGLNPGNYRVLFVRPNGFVFTTNDVPTDDCVDSDADRVTGMTTCIALAAGQTNLCVDAGLVPTNCPPLQLVCPQNIVGECAILGTPANINALTNLFSPPAVIGGGGGVVLTYSNLVVTTGSCPTKLFIIRIWRAVDSCSNSATCSQSITIVDTTPPNITCGDNQIVECNQPFTFTPPYAVDACDGTNVVIRLLGTVTTPVSPRCPGLTNIIRTWSATDTCGNSNICSQTITIVDTTPPNITCARDQIVECNQPFSFTPPFAVDTCDGTNVIIRIVSTITTVPNPRCPGLTNIVRTWSASDSCGNSNMCTQTITIVDTTPPNITCAHDLVVECGTPFVFTPPFAVDACEGTNVTIRILSTVTTAVNPRCPGLTNIVRTWSASDSCGNSNVCSQTITIVDTTPPNITCVDNQIVECNQPFAFIPPFAVDICDGTNVTIRILSTTTTAVSPRCPGLTNIVRVWSASDSCGNSNVCSQTITIVDTTPPNITCAHDQIVECGTPFAFTPPFAVDACEGTNVTIRILSTVTTAANPRCPGLTNIVRTWSASDSCGNSNVCSQTITIVDTTPPNITCADNQIVECGNPFAFIPPFAVDICDGANVTIRIVSTVTTAANPRCPGMTNVVRTWSASDSCGNSNMCSQTITLVDTTPPNITCGDDLIVECGLPFAFTLPYAVDICDGTNVTIRILSTVTTPANPRCPGLTNIVRTWSATDSCGNSNVCSQSITIVDTTPPNITCGDNRIVECGNPFSFTPPFAVDACDGTNVVIRILSTITTAAVPRCPTLTNIVRTWSATDSCGNSNVCTQTISIVDTRPPQMICAEDRVVECGFPWAFDVPSAVDVCDGTNVSITISSTVTNTGSCPGNFSVVRTWKASDSCSNSITCRQTILVVDTRPPIITCAPDFNVECGIPWSFELPTARDLCDGTNVPVRLVNTVTNPICGKTFAATRTWEAVDMCGNRSTCRQTVTVEDTLPPHITCTNQVVPCAGIITTNPPGASDFCDGTNVTVTLVNTFTNGGIIYRTWIATDSCWNTATCNQQITVLSCTNCISVEKLIACYQPNDTCGTFGKTATGYKSGTNNPAFCYSITVLNCGPFALTNVMVMDDKLGDLTSAFFPSPNVPLLPNVPVTKIFKKDWAVDTLNTVVVKGTSVQDRSMVFATNSAMAIVDQAAITCAMYLYSPDDIDGVRGDSKVTFSSGQPHSVTFTNVICNVGDATLTGITITVPGLNCVFPVPATLAPGACYASVCTTTLTCPPMQTYTATVTARVDTNANHCGYDIHGSNITVSSTCDSMIMCQTPPDICVVKTIACYLPGNTCGPFDKVAAGVRSETVDPAFCYSITISNCGGITLTNVTVIDNKLGDLTSTFFASRLTPFPPGTSITRGYKMAWHVTTTNTVVAAGKAASAGAQPVTDQDMAVAIVVPASITCQAIVTSPDDIDNTPGDNHITIPDDGAPHMVTFAMMVCNPSSVNLMNVVIHTPGLDAYGCAEPAPFNLPAGECQTVVLCMANLTCSGNTLTFNSSIIAQVDTSGGVCGYDIRGSNVLIQTTNCPMTIECPSQGACRVTGGGRQENTYPPVLYMTHGGQVGAPVGRAGFDPGTFQREGSECIHGNWEVVRHAKGGSRGNFHAKIYDSLMCACLSCPENPGSGIVIGDLCNPGDRICGPEPRKSPANKICFSGIGDYTMTSGNRIPRSVLFRVDIEDRSEPGNNGKPSENPPDRHRIRIWILTSAELAQLNNPNDRLLDFRRAISCAAGNTGLQDGAIGANGLAVPLGTAVFGVRAPDVDDGGEMDHGNHQIHPMIKDCP